MTSAHVLERLRGVASPFSDMCAPTPFAGRSSDVSEITSDAMGRVQSLIEVKARKPRIPLGCLVVGQAGSGKTHFLGSLCRGVRPDGGYTFADVQPLKNHHQPLKHILGEIVGNLVKRPPADLEYTQLERIVARTIARVLRGYYQDAPPAARAHALEVADRFEGSPEKMRMIKDAAGWEKSCKEVRRWLVQRHPEMSDDCLRVFLQYPLAEKRPLVVAWLRGENLDDEDLQALGVPVDPAQTTPEALEQRASSTLRTLGHLLEFDRPLVVCFDHLDGIDDPNHPGRLPAFEEIINDLFDYVPSVFILCCVRGDVWNRLTQRLSAPVVGRLGGNRFELRGCDAGLAQRLIESRLRSAMEGLGLAEAAPPLCPFDQPSIQSELERELSKGWLSPRVVLQKANRLWHEALGTEAQALRDEDPVEIQAAWLEARRQLILTDLERYGPHEGMLTEALELFYRYLPTGGEGPAGRCRLTRVDRYVDLIVEVPVGKTSRRVGFLVDVEYNANAVAASIRHGRELSDRGKVDTLVFVRDERVPFPARPKWPATNKLREALEREGGTCVFLTTDEVARWFALVHLHQAILAQDLSFQEGAANVQVVTLHHFQKMLGSVRLDARFGDILSLCLGRPTAGQTPQRESVTRGPAGPQRPTGPAAVPAASARPAPGDLRVTVHAAGPAPGSVHHGGSPPREGSGAAPGGSPPMGGSDRLGEAAEKILLTSPVKMMVAKKVYKALPAPLRLASTFPVFLEAVRQRPAIKTIQAKDDIILTLKVLK